MLLAGIDLPVLVFSLSEVGVVFWFCCSLSGCCGPRVAWGSFYLSCLCFCVCGPPALVSWRAAVWSLSLRWGDALVCRRPCLGLVLAAVLLFYVLHLLVTLY